MLSADMLWLAASLVKSSNFIADKRIFEAQKAEPVCMRAAGEGGVGVFGIGLMVNWLFKAQCLRKRHQR